MDFSFNEDQLLIADTADAFLTSASNSAQVRAAMSTELGYEPALWQQTTQELAWQLTHIPESEGGLGLGYVELCILFEKMGKHLCCSPFFSTVALSLNSLLLVAANDCAKSAIAAIAEQGERFALAYSGGGRLVGLDSITALYHDSDSYNGVCLTGDYHYVIDGHTASSFIVAAKNASNGQLGLFLVPKEKVDVAWTATMDQTRKLARVSIREAEVPASNILSCDSTTKGTFENVLNLACIALAAEQLGVAEQCLSQTVDYISERKQFGRAVGSFQAMKHKAADMMNRAEAARSAVYYAACIADEFLGGQPLGAELSEAASIAKAYCCDAAFFNAGMALQMYGGVGFTWEYDVHLYFKRAKAAQLTFGDSAYHRERIAQLVLEQIA